jgi:hypothetical protein
MSTRRLVILLSALTLGCKTPCQALCDDMADYFEECGNTTSDDAIDACYTDHGRDGTTEEEQDTCREFSENIRDEWTCEDIESYFD